MRIVTWNVNSLKARREVVEAFLDAETPDVLCMQELKLETDAVPVEIFETRGYEVAVHGQKQFNGVAIASKLPLTDIHRGLTPADEGQARLIAATVAGVHIVNLYCPQGQSEDSPKFAYKLAFYDALLAWLRDHHEETDELLVTGDLNIAPERDDVWDPGEFENVPSFHPLEHERWAKLIAWGLRDVVYPRLPDNPKLRYTYWDYRGMAFRFNRGMRIDHHLASPALAKRVIDAGVLRDWRRKREGRTPSDHAPLTLTIG